MLLQVGRRIPGSRRSDLDPQRARGNDCFPLSPLWIGYIHTHRHIVGHLGLCIYPSMWFLVTKQKPVCPSDSQFITGSQVLGTELSPTPFPHTPSLTS